MTKKQNSSLQTVISLVLALIAETKRLMVTSVKLAVHL